MAFKEVTEERVDAIAIQKQQVGFQCTGVYTKVATIPSKDSNRGDSKLYTFNGTQKKFGVWGFTNLDRAMDNVATGSMVRLTFLGTKPVQTKSFGVVNAHQVKVEVDDEYNAQNASTSSTDVPFEPPHNDNDAPPVEQDMYN